MIVAVGVAVFLAYLHSWWWLAAPVAAYLVLAISSVIIRRRRDTHKDESLKSLAIPLYGLFHIESIEQSSKGGYLYDIVPAFSENYTPEQQHQIMGAMEAALTDPDIDFSGVLPDLPFSDDQIRIHLRETLERLGRQD